MNKKTKILVFTIPPVNKNSSNTYEILFKNCVDTFDFYSLSCRDGQSNSDTFIKTYRLSERKAYKSVFKRNVDVFEEVMNNKADDNTLNVYKSNRGFHNIKRIARDILWSLSTYKKSSLNSFLEESNFDLIVASSEASHYYLRILKYICKKTNAKLILYTWDDNFTYKQQQISLLFYIYRHKTRQLLRSISKKYLTATFSNTEKTKEESDKFFNSDSYIVKKSYSYDSTNTKTNDKNKINIIYAGNLLNGRDKEIYRLAKVLEDPLLNNMELNIYTNSNNNKLINKFQNFSNTKIHPTIPHSELIKIQANADIGLIIESLKYRKRKISRLSLSTKFTDYIASSLPMLAIIDKESATAREINNNHIGVVVDQTKDFKKALLKLSNESNLNYLKNNVNDYKIKVNNNNLCSILSDIIRKD